MTSESEVVLTKMKFFNNFQEKLLIAEDSLSTVSMSVSEQDVSIQLHGDEAISVHSAVPELNMAKKDYLSGMFTSSKLPSLYKFESEDSGVEMPSGANSPSTPTGSEHSFVVHSRESSCDSGNQDSEIPVNSLPLHLLGQSTDSLQTEKAPCTCTQNNIPEVLQDRLENKMANVLPNLEGDLDVIESRTIEDTLESFTEDSACVGTLETRTNSEDNEESTPRSHVIEAYDGNVGVEVQQHPLRKSTTSDSLDKYMEECCRLSEANQAQSNPLGSGLGYLEHICQLIEKIGQLQEHNLKLQKQICDLQNDKKMKKTKENFFLQHCHCGAASLAFQELNSHHRSDYTSLTASNGTLSDLTTIPEGTHISLRTAFRDCEGNCLSTVPLRRRGFTRRSYTEGEARYLSDSSEILSSPQRRLENYTWGRVKDLVRKSKLRNQSRLGLSSSSFKRSCPQLYRPELGLVELSRGDRNSMIILGHQKLDGRWGH